MVEWNAEVMLGEDESVTMGFLVVCGEEDNGTANSRNVGQGRPPLPDKMSTFGVPWRKWMRIDVSQCDCGR
jgi:hypothetical protein